MWKRQVVDELKYIIELDGVGPVDNRPSMNKDGSPKKLCLERRKNGLFSRMNKKIWEKNQISIAGQFCFLWCVFFCFVFYYTTFYHFFIDRNLTWWAALITDPPPSSSTNWSFFFGLWDVTCYTWHMKHYVTCDTWKNRGWWTLSQSFRSLALTVCEYWCHVIRDTWHMTCDTWQATCDMWHVTHRGK